MHIRCDPGRIVPFVVVHISTDVNTIRALERLIKDLRLVKETQSFKLSGGHHLLDRGKLLVVNPCVTCQAGWYQPWGRRAARLRREWRTEYGEREERTKSVADLLTASQGENTNAASTPPSSLPGGTSLKDDRVAALGIRVALTLFSPTAPCCLTQAEDFYHRRWGPLNAKLRGKLPSEPSIEALASLAAAAAAVLVVATPPEAAAAAAAAESNGGDTGAGSGSASPSPSIGANASANLAITTLFDSIAGLKQCVGDVHTVLSPAAVALLGGAILSLSRSPATAAAAAAAAIPESAATEHGRMVQRAADVAAKGAKSVVKGRRPEALHGCVMLDGSGNLISTGYNHTLADASHLPPALLDALPELQGMVGDHRQWQRAWDKGNSGDGSIAGGANQKGLPTSKEMDGCRLSLHAEQHAVLQAAAAGTLDSLRGGSCYIVEVDNAEPVFAEAYPCSVCWPLVKHCGLRYVYFTTPTGLKQLDFGVTLPSPPTQPHEQQLPQVQGPQATMAAATTPVVAAAVGVAFSAARDIYTGTVKETAMKKFGFIAADDSTIGDVFFPLRVLKLSEKDSNNPDLNQFPDGSPMLHAPFRSFLSGRRAQFQLETTEEEGRDEGRSAPTPEIESQSQSHRNYQRLKRPMRPQASVVTPL